MRNSSVTASFCFRYENTTRREWVVSSFDLVTRGSTNMRTALAFASVVSMRLCRISDEAMFESIALRCPA